MTTETHGYNAVQVGYQVVAERKITKPELNHLKKSGCPPMRKLKEYRVRAISLEMALVSSCLSTPEPVLGNPCSLHTSGVICLVLREAL